MPSRDEFQELMAKLIRQHDGSLRRMAQSNGALLAEYRDCVVEIALRAYDGRGVPEKYAESVDELANEIVRRMDGNGS